MTVVIDTERARALRGGLARQLADAGHDRRWVGAVEAVPRHLFVPAFHQQGSTGEWERISAGDTGYLDGVYADRALTTQLTDTVPTSSSSEPDLMLTMLDALEVSPGHRVLEVGTGTGYNAALLAHVLGDVNVTTIDVDPELTTLAAERLRAAGYNPAVHTGDGAVGVASQAPFDRIIATCGMQSIPWRWVEQAADGAVMVVPIGWGLAKITVRAGRAEGRFLPEGAYFMARRAPGAEPRFAGLENIQPSTTKVPVAGLLDRLRFPLALALPGYRSCTWSDDATGELEALGIWMPDGSTATAHVDGTVRQLGLTGLWDVIEQLDSQFSTTPAREDFGLTLTPATQRAWWKSEDGPGWELPLTAFAA
ncbi:methyltransferase domain-containing protein [Kitasatospora sp. NPDC093558]|uniref:methyltransferase domain-containing protein n=1 Tax=Kitasatospora sp. NPDC093558 TaxID=3155201 RepID=UPI0034483A28